MLTKVDCIYRSDIAAKCLHAECGHCVSDIAVRRVMSATKTIPE